MEIQGKGLSGSGAAGMYVLCVLIWVQAQDFGEMIVASWDLGLS